MNKRRIILNDNFTQPFPAKTIDKLTDTHIDYTEIPQHGKISTHSH